MISAIEKIDDSSVETHVRPFVRSFVRSFTQKLHRVIRLMLTQRKGNDGMRTAKGNLTRLLTFHSGNDIVGRA